ncbi:U-box domain-containing protein 7 [Heracleum sosnowskyi]|uniref:U-box domain-containing protein 7 n=1 Tax=Heracleum sosnowskyi TaxID=360622 RepID=A0AAD8HK43_9APIA|nr:U-box domain-containing protein 7 [Heracleum sosnowskyi]
MSDHTSTWHSAITKLRFFTRIRRFLNPKSSMKLHEPSDPSNIKEKVANMNDQEEEEKEQEMVVLQTAVKNLHFGSCEEIEMAARDIKKLAAEGLSRRKFMAELGVIPPLVAMAGSEVVARQRLAVQALIELANGTYTNKALIMDAGILTKLPENIGVFDEETLHDFAQLILSISSLANSQFPINSSMIVPFVISILDSNSSLETKESCLGTLYNLSNMLDNANTLASNEVFNILLSLSSVEQTSEKALATLGNLVVTLTGKKLLESNPKVPESLIEIMTWDDKPRSQELSAYVLMILAHQSSVQRLKMANAGIVPILLEVSLLSSPLAQKRALRLLQLFKDERQTRMRPHSGPQTRRLSSGSPVNQRDVIEGKKVMKNMVKQSLYKNMESMALRANGDESSSKLKYFVISSSSKSLPY